MVLSVHTFGLRIDGLPPVSGRGERIIHNPVDLEATKELRSFQTFEGDPGSTRINQILNLI